MMIPKMLVVVLLIAVGMIVVRDHVHLPALLLLLLSSTGCFLLPPPPLPPNIHPHTAARSSSRYLLRLLVLLDRDPSMRFN